MWSGAALHKSRGAKSVPNSMKFVFVASFIALASCAKITIPNAKSIVTRGQSWTLAWKTEVADPGAFILSYTSVTEQGVPLSAEEQLQVPSTAIDAKKGYIMLPAQFPKSGWYQAVLRSKEPKKRVVVGTSVPFFVK